MNFDLDGYSSTNFGNSSSELFAKLIVNNKNKDQLVNFFLPGYFCGQSLKYLRSINVNFIFYKLTSDLLPDYEELENLAKSNRVDYFLIVHYFGRIKGQLKAAKFAQEKKTILIEDCTHIISPLISRKWVGDFLFFSPYKHFDIPEIGFLLSKKEMNLMQNGFLNNYSWRIKKAIKKFTGYKNNSSWGTVISGSSLNFKLKIPSIKSQERAINLMKLNKKDINNRMNEIVNLKKTLYSIPGWKPFIVFKKGDLPYLIPMICDNKLIAKDRFNMLNIENQIVMQWPDIPIELMQIKEIYQQTNDWVERGLFFLIPNNIDSLILKIDKIRFT